MASNASLEQRGDANVPLAGQAMSIVISLVATTVLTLFMTQRFLAIKVWKKLPFVVWLVFAIYIDSYFFVLATAILEHSFGVNTNILTCRGAILLCLACYVTTKFIYLFLAEKAYIIRGTKKRRMKSRLYLFNCFGMLGIYIVVVTLNFVFRITKMEDGQCIIGMKSGAMIPLISFDAVVNVYLTIIFLIPLKNMYTFKNMARTPANLRLRTIAFRTFVGAASTLVSSIVNLSVLMALGGEPGWVCLMCCNCDILFSAIVIQWVTSKDNAGTSSPTSSANYQTSTLPTHSRHFSAHSDHHQAASCADELALVTTSSGPPPPPSSASTNTTFEDPLKPPNAVVITTTIKRESQPSDSVMGTNNDDDGLGRGRGFEPVRAAPGYQRGASGPRDVSGGRGFEEDRIPGYRGSRRMSCGTEGFVGSVTCITGGPQSDDPRVRH